VGIYKEDDDGIDFFITGILPWNTLLKKPDCQSEWVIWRINLVLTCSYLNTFAQVRPANALHRPSSEEFFSPHNSGGFLAAALIRLKDGDQISPPNSEEPLKTGIR